jgi:hypothetical protein
MDVSRSIDNGNVEIVSPFDRERTNTSKEANKQTKHYFIRRPPHTHTHHVNGCVREREQRQRDTESGQRQKHTHRAHTHRTDPGCPRRLWRRVGAFVCVRIIAARGEFELDRGVAGARRTREFFFFFLYGVGPPACLSTREDACVRATDERARPDGETKKRREREREKERACVCVCVCCCGWGSCVPTFVSAHRRSSSFETIATGRERAEGVSE